VTPQQKRQQWTLVLDLLIVTVVYLVYMNFVVK
jgi:hypothetical protein